MADSWNPSWKRELYETESQGIERDAVIRAPTIDQADFYKNHLSSSGAVGKLNWARVDARERTLFTEIKVNEDPRKWRGQRRWKRREHATLKTTLKGHGSVDEKPVAATLAASRCLIINVVPRRGLRNRVYTLIAVMQCLSDTQWQFALIGHLVA